VTAGLTTGMAHITGGGITENLPRILPKNTTAQIEIGFLAGTADLRASARPGPGFARGDDAPQFNMGIGLIAAIPAVKFAARKKPAGQGRREVLRHRTRGQGRAPGTVHII